jgi:sugar phosphate isomerase/epimerase
VHDGATIVEEVGHPNLQLLADLYHMAEEKEPVANVAEAGKLIRHTHLADRGRVAPGYSTQGEEDFIGFFRALRQAGYNARCSFEGSFSDMSTQLKPSLDLMRQRWEESAS